MLRAQAGYAFEAPAGPGAVSYFTAAVVRAIEGQAAEPVTGDRWAVTTERIGRHIDTLLHRERGGRDLYVDRQMLGTGVIRRLTAVPSTMIGVECDPVAALVLATLGCVSHPDAHIAVHQKPGQRGRWNVEVPAGRYTVTAVFDDDPYADAEHLVFAEPPECLVALQVLP